jgi:hypothetical protein
LVPADSDENLLQIIRIWIHVADGSHGALTARLGIVGVAGATCQK